MRLNFSRPDTISKHIHIFLRFNLFIESESQLIDKVAQLVRCWISN